MLRKKISAKFRSQTEREFTQPRLLCQKLRVTGEATFVRGVIIVMTGDCEVLQSLLKGWCNFLEITQQQQILKFAIKQGCITVLYVHKQYAHFFSQPLKPCQLKNPACPDRQARLVDYILTQK